MSVLCITYFHSRLFEFIARVEDAACNARLILLLLTDRFWFFRSVIHNYERVHGLWPVLVVNLPPLWLEDTGCSTALDLA